MFPIVPRGSFDTVIAAKHDALPPTVSAKSTDKKGNCYIFLYLRNGTTYQKLCCMFFSVVTKMKALTGANLNLIRHEMVNQSRNNLIDINSIRYLWKQFN